MITSPSNSIPLPDDIKNALEQGQNQVSTLQAETTRLQRLKSQIERDLVSLSGERTSLENSISVSKTQLEKITSDCEGATSNLNAIKSQVEASILLRDTTNKEITAKHLELDSKTKDLQASIVAFQLEKSKLDQSILEHNKDKELFESKKELLKNTISKIS